MSLSLARLGVTAASFPMSAGDFEAIATITVGSGGASSIEFTSIPSTYQHLQIRGIVRDARTPASSAENVQYQLNGDTNGSNYYFHQLRGDGSSAAAGSFTNSSFSLLWQFIVNSTGTANVFAPLVVDILDYTETSKNTTIRTFAGYDMNGSGNVGIGSSLWSSTSVVNAFKLLTWSGSNFVQHSTLALYGIKA